MKNLLQARGAWVLVAVVSLVLVGASRGFAAPPPPSSGPAGFISIEKDPSVPAQNIGINVADQPIGAFVVIVRGEPVTVQKMVFNLDLINSNGDSDDGTSIDQIKMVYTNGGQVLAGPVDGTATSVIFTDAVTFPIGKTHIKLVAKLDTSMDSNDIITVTTTPSSDWKRAYGVQTGQFILVNPSLLVVSNMMVAKKP